MPIFMDRHDVSDTTTAENVAQLHQQDLKIQHQFGCRGMTYWFDAKRKTAFCLIEAPDKDAIVRMHDHAHGQVPHKVIAVDSGIGESFLGRIEDPENAQNTAFTIIDDPAFRTIIVLRLSRAAFEPMDGSNATFGDYVDNIVDILNKAQGNIVKQSEAGLLLSFKSVTNAVAVCFDIQSFLQRQGSDAPVVKIGLSAGAPVTEKHSIFEETVKTAERLCQMVPGEIIITSEVKDLYNSENAKSLQLGDSICCITPPAERFLNAFADYTELNWRNTPLKIDDLARALGQSRSKLYRSVISLTGLSPNGFLKEFRLNKALELLAKNAKNVSEIAFETGFGSVSYFSKCFQKKYGYLPSGHLSAKNPKTVKS